jgi:hypothetical protein
MRLKRLLSAGFLSLCLLAFFATPAQAQFFDNLPSGQIGVSVGGTVETMDDLDAGITEASFDQSVGFHFGASFEQTLANSEPLSALSVRTGIFARRVGEYSFPGEVEPVANEVTDATPLIENRSFQVWTIEFPLDIKYAFDVADLPARPYLLAGPQVSILRADEDFETTMNDASVSINAGLGAEVDLPFNLTLMPEFRYEFGVTDAFEDAPRYRLNNLTVNDSPSVGGPSLRVNLFYTLY